MATYFHGAPEMQPDGLQTLYLMNPGYAGYPDGAAAPANMVFLNSMNSLNPMSIAHSSQPSQQQQQHLVGIPLQPMAPSPDSGRPASIHPSQEVSAIHGLAPRLHYNLWTPATSNNSIDMPSPSSLGPRRPSPVPAPQQGLSLSLSPHQIMYRPESEVLAMAPEVKDLRPLPPAVPGMQSVFMGSKYLKVAQQLLDEVVSVGKGIRDGFTKGADSKSPMKSSRESDAVIEADTSAKRGADLTTAERQELQMKKAKLVNMLEEVEQRYRQYRHQMQIVVSSFEAVAGLGSGRTYTALALQTISKQFRCLRDAISGQIRATSKSLGEEDSPLGGTKSTGSRLRFVDHQLRQQRTLQQLGMIQHNAWRPQRGLPERAVSVLRAWLFEHFLHPYPKDADKHMLAKQTGLTRSQVSNWFINARVRLWKPMVEEMYSEEFKDGEQNNADEKPSKSDANEDSASKSSAHQETSPAGTEQTDSHQTEQVTITPSFLGIVETHEGIMQPCLKKTRSDQSMGVEMKPQAMSNRDLLMQFMDGGSGGDNGYSLMAGTTSHGGAFGGYSIGELERFDHEQFAPRFSGNGVSLTLGLQHTENLSLSGAQPSYLSRESIPLGRRVGITNESDDYNNPTTSLAPNTYETINIQNRKRFAAQLLPDFVA